MRLIRVEFDSSESYGVLEDDDRVHLIDGDPCGQRVASGTSVALAECRILPPVAPTKIVAVGRNYAAHVEEMGFEPGSSPSIFMKPLQTLVPADGTVVLPPRSLSSNVEHEGELAVVIGREARNVSKEDAAEYVLGFTCANDVSARDLQKRDTHITRGKGFDTFCPLGPWVETDISITDHYDVTCSVNGELRQNGSTRELIYDIPTLIEHITQWTTLAPGDIILTGSPAGTGPLQPGDQVEVSVSGVGTLRHTVVAAPEDRTG